MKRVLVLQHAEAEHLGQIANVFQKAGVSPTIVRVDLDCPIPKALEGYDGMVIMGGPQSVYEKGRFPFFQTESALVRDAIERDRPVLGVCLGSEVLAETLGAQVYASGVLEIGWHAVTVSSGTKDDLVFGQLPPLLTPFHWHGDAYELPVGAKPLGASAKTAVQGFVWRDKFYGILFHLEITVAQVSAMVAGFPGDVERGGTPSDLILKDAVAKIETLRPYCMKAFTRWTELL